MTLLCLPTGQQSISFMRSSTGQEPTEFWEKQSKIRSEATGGEVAHTYKEVIKATNTTLLCYLSRDRAIINLLHKVLPQSPSLWHK